MSESEEIKMPKKPRVITITKETGKTASIPNLSRSEMKTVWIVVERLHPDWREILLESCGRLIACRLENEKRLRRSREMAEEVVFLDELMQVRFPLQNLPTPH